MPEQRERKRTIGLSDLEDDVCEAVMIYLGGDATTCLRQGLLDLGRKCGITVLNAREFLEQYEKAQKKKAPKA